MRKHFSLVKSGLSFSAHFRIVWTCLLIPDAIENDSPSHQLAANWDKGNPGDPDITLLYAMSLYRQGKYAESLERLVESQRLFDLGLPSIGTPIYVMLMRAMACQRLGQVDEANNWLSNAKSAITNEQAEFLAADTPWKNPWERRATLSTLQREAERVLSESE